MAANFEDKETRAFIKPIEDSSLDADFGDFGVDNLSPLDDSYDDEPILKTPTKPVQPKNRPNLTALFFMILLLVAVAAWWVYSKNLAMFDEKFVEPEIDNTIQLNTADNLDVVEPSSIDNKAPNINVDAANVGTGNYFLALDRCSFQECVNNFENILIRAELPIDKISSNQYFKFIRLVSKQNFPTERLLADDGFNTIQAKLPDDLKLSTIPVSNGRNLITIGLFTTVQKAKSTKNSIEKTASLMGFDITFELKEVSVRQTVTTVYAGPFRNKNAAGKVLAELKSTSPIKTARIVQR